MLYAYKVGVLAFDATRLCAADVDYPMDVVLYSKGSFQLVEHRYEQALAEVEDMKRRLREHAQNVAAREKELEELRLEVAGRQGRRRASAPASAPSGPDRSGELAKKIAEAEKREREAVQELALAKAERERLDEREQSIRKVERELDESTAFWFIREFWDGRQKQWPLTRTDTALKPLTGSA